MKKREEKRKERSDKKVDIKPFVPLDVYENYASISYIIGKSIMDVGHFFIMEGIKEKRIIEYLADKGCFKRNYSNDNLHIIANRDAEHKRTIKDDLKKRRLSIRLKKEEYSTFCDLCSALDLTVSSTARLILEVTILDITIIDRCIRNYTKTEKINDSKRSELNLVVKYIKKNSPFHEDDSFWKLIKDILKDLF